ncbi:MAG: ATPase domain-containing protein, partial [Patescibacteria group bacterium]
MRSRSNFVCQQCGYSQVSWAGKCPNCGTWNSLVETLIETSDKKRVTRKELVKPVPLSLIPSRMTSRILTKISELDRVLGGGLVLGHVVIIAGEPGIGKSTLLLQVA